MKSIWKLCAAALIAAGAFTGLAQAQQAKMAHGVPFVAQTDRLIIKYKDSEPNGKGAAHAAPISQARKALIDRAGQQFGQTMKLLHTIGTGAHVMQLDHKMSLDEAQAMAADLMAGDPSVEYAEPDRIMTAQFTPNDPQYSNQWDYYDATGGLRLPAAWDKSTGAGINVAVIDTGYRPHADLSGQILPGYDFISSATIANDGNGRDSDASDPGDWAPAGSCGTGVPSSDQPSSWHGTHVAGTIAALTNNGVGVAGVAYGAKIVPARVLGRCGGYTSDIADAMIWASGGTISGVPDNANRARVLNLSLGGSGACDSTTQNAINSARSRGSVVVVAAGNSNVNASNASPANCQGVIVVAATNRAGGKASYSNYGAIVTVAAPGGDSTGGILSTLNAGTTTPAGDTYAYYMGTSMATPHVAGVVALMLSKNPSLTPDDVAARLKATARPFPAACSGCGAGIVDASAAVTAAIGTTTTPTAPTINETESNNTLASANPVSTSGTTVNGNMGSSTDTDYFVVQLPAGKSLTATLTPNASSDYDLYVYDANGTLLGKSVNGAGQIDAVTLANGSSATVARYVRVYYYAGGTGATGGKYTLKLGW
ncbi:S8 family peptidase [Massilia terrae]|uniref:S8 family peptidase n=1 Tax=Massilia terrae TaxID=1811224 RepID=A0ABT2D2D7_9BURK|nr:S8 family peptidase [Massilia terrae]MCS0659946.1 S8 family peptidase [Massilia terrae]